MTQLIHFNDSCPCAGRFEEFIAGHGRVAMPPSLSFLTTRWVAANGARPDTLRVGLIAIFHIVALYIMATTEYALEQKAAFLLTWGALNFFWLAVLRRPGVSAAISLTMVVLLVELSHLKWSVLWM